MRKFLSEVWDEIKEAFSPLFIKRTRGAWIVFGVVAILFLSDKLDSIDSVLGKVGRMGTAYKFIVDAMHSTAVQVCLFFVGCLWIGIAAIIAGWRRDEPPTAIPNLGLSGRLETELIKGKAGIEPLEQRQKASCPVSARESVAPATPSSSEEQRRADLLARLRNEYIGSHDNISPALNAGTEDWLNRRLKELGENWVYKPSPTPALPPTIHDLFEHDFPNHRPKFFSEYNIESDDGLKSKIRFQIHYDYEAKSQFVSVYVSPDTYKVCMSLPKLCREMLADLNSKTYADAQIPGNPSKDYAKDLVFTGKVFVYYDGDLTLAQLGALETLFQAEKLSVQFRGRSYATTRWLQSQVTKLSSLG